MSTRPHVVTERDLEDDPFGPDTQTWAVPNTSSSGMPVRPGVGPVRRGSTKPQEAALASRLLPSSGDGGARLADIPSPPKRPVSASERYQDIRRRTRQSGLALGSSGMSSTGNAGDANIGILGVSLGGTNDRPQSSDPSSHSQRQDGSSIAHGTSLYPPSPVTPLGGAGSVATRLDRRARHPQPTGSTPAWMRTLGTTSTSTSSTPLPGPPSLIGSSNPVSSNVRSHATPLRPSSSGSLYGNGDAQGTLVGLTPLSARLYGTTQEQTSNHTRHVLPATRSPSTAAPTTSGMKGSNNSSHNAGRTSSGIRRSVSDAHPGLVPSSHSSSSSSSPPSPHDGSTISNSMTRQRKPSFSGYQGVTGNPTTDNRDRNGHTTNEDGLSVVGDAWLEGNSPIANDYRASQSNNSGSSSSGGRESVNNFMTANSPGDGSGINGLGPDWWKVRELEKRVAELMERLNDAERDKKLAEQKCEEHEQRVTLYSRMQAKADAMAVSMAEKNEALTKQLSERTKERDEVRGTVLELEVAMETMGNQLTQAQQRLSEVEMENETLRRQVEKGRHGYNQPHDVVNNGTMDRQGREGVSNRNGDEGNDVELDGSMSMFLSNSVYPSTDISNITASSAVQATSPRITSNNRTNISCDAHHEPERQIRDTSGYISPPMTYITSSTSSSTSSSSPFRFGSVLASPFASLATTDTSSSLSQPSATITSTSSVPTASPSHSPLTVITLPTPLPPPQPLPLPLPSLISSPTPTPQPSKPASALSPSTISSSSPSSLQSHMPSSSSSSAAARSVLVALGLSKLTHSKSSTQSPVHAPDKQSEQTQQQQEQQRQKEEEQQNVDVQHDQQSQQQTSNTSSGQPTDPNHNQVSSSKPHLPTAKPNILAVLGLSKLAKSSTRSEASQLSKDVDNYPRTVDAKSPLPTLTHDADTPPLTGMARKEQVPMNSNHLKALAALGLGKIVKGTNDLRSTRTEGCQSRTPSIPTSNKGTSLIEEKKKTKVTDRTINDGDLYDNDTYTGDVVDDHADLSPDSLSDSFEYPASEMSDTEEEEDAGGITGGSGGGGSGGQDGKRGFKLNLGLLKGLGQQGSTSQQSNLSGLGIQSGGFVDNLDHKQHNDNADESSDGIVSLRQGNLNGGEGYGGMGHQGRRLLDMENEGGLSFELSSGLIRRGNIAVGKHGMIYTRSRQHGGQNSGKEGKVGGRLPTIASATSTPVKKKRSDDDEHGDDMIGRSGDRMVIGGDGGDGDGGDDGVIGHFPTDPSPHDSSTNKQNKLNTESNTDAASDTYDVGMGDWLSPEDLDRVLSARVNDNDITNNNNTMLTSRSSTRNSNTPTNSVTPTPRHDTSSTSARSGRTDMQSSRSLYRQTNDTSSQPNLDNVYNITSNLDIITKPSRPDSASSVGSNHSSITSYRRYPNSSPSQGNINIINTKSKSSSKALEEVHSDEDTYRVDTSALVRLNALGRGSCATVYRAFDTGRYLHQLNTIHSYPATNTSSSPGNDAENPIHALSLSDTRVGAPECEIVALKCVRIGDKDKRKQVFAEIELFAAVSSSLRPHPNICRFLGAYFESSTPDYYHASPSSLPLSSSPIPRFVRPDSASLMSDPGEICLVLEYLHGGSLQDLVDRCGRLNESVCAFILYECLKGVDFLHRKRMIHRDVKPQNVLLSRRGEVKLSDFGIASSLAMKKSDTQMTKVLNMNGGIAVLGNGSHISNRTSSSGRVEDEDGQDNVSNLPSFAKGLPLDASLTGSTTPSMLSSSSSPSPSTPTPSAIPTDPLSNHRGKTVDTGPNHLPPFTSSSSSSSSSPFPRSYDMNSTFTQSMMQPYDPSAFLANTFVGTIIYMSPERLAGKTYSSACDIWALGMTLLTCLLGRFYHIYPCILSLPFVISVWVFC